MYVTQTAYADPGGVGGGGPPNPKSWICAWTGTLTHTKSVRTNCKYIQNVNTNGYWEQVKT